MSKINYNDFTDKLIDRLNELGFNQNEVYISKSSILGLEKRNGKLVIPQFMGEHGFQIRTIADGILRTCYSDDFSDTGIENIQRHLSFGGVKFKKEYSFSLKENDELSKLDEFEENLHLIPLFDKWNLVDELIEKTYEQNIFIKMIPQAQYRQIQETVHYGNNNGVRRSFFSEGFQLSVNAMGRKGNLHSNGLGVSLATKFEKLRLNDVAEMAGENARIKLFRDNIESGNYSVLFKPYAATMLSYLVWSLITGKLNPDIHPEEMKFSKKMNIIDNPLLKEAPGSTPFDCEGSSTMITDIIRDGEFKNKLSSRQASVLFGTENTASARLSSVSGIRFISVSNMYIEPQDALTAIPDDDFLEVHLLELPPDLFYEENKMKLMASGTLRTKNDSLPFSGVAISIPLDDFPGNVKSVGYDLNFYSIGQDGIFGGPSVLVDNMKIFKN